MNIKQYIISGWSAVSDQYFFIQEQTGQKDQFDMYDLVTNSKKIKIYPYKDSSNENEVKYHKKYKSKHGFDVNKVFTLILKTYWKSVKDINKKSQHVISGMKLYGFTFDPNNKHVYPLVFY